MDMIVVLGGRYAGGADYAEKHFPGYRILTGYEERIRKQMERGEDPLLLAGSFVEELEEQSVLVLTEMGCGIVPAEHGERQFREMNGRVNCIFAEQAEQVIRVIAGVGQRIK